MFALHPVLAADTVEITTWDLCQLRLMKDANYPWLVLVPARNGITGMHQLAASDGATLMTEITRASDLLEKAHKPDRINVAALGNMVPQLHVHVIARFETDPAWPGPVWGAARRKDYSDEGMRRAVAAFEQAPTS